MSNKTDLDRLWEEITSVGGIDQYVDKQLRDKGFLVQRRPTEGMSKKKLQEYKESLKREAAERRAVRKQSWLAYRETHIVHVGEGVFYNDGANIDRWDLENAEERAAENELPKLDNPTQLSKAMGLTISQLRWLAYHRDAAESIHYRAFTIPKRNGSKRQIWAPLPKLKAAQRWILSNIVERLPIHGAAHGFLPGRSIASNAAVHTNSKIVVKIDLENFFPTITFPRVKGIFRRAGYREQVATLLSLICTEAPREIVDHQGKVYYIAMGPRCLPQGAPTSPALTNTLCQRLDRRLTGLAKKLNWRYTRYADDLTFSLPESQDCAPALGNLMGSVGRIAADEGFKVNAKKTRIARKGARQKITGLVVNGEGGPRVPRKVRRRIRAVIHNLKNGKALKEGDTLEQMKGYAAYIYMTHPELGRKFIEDLSSFGQENSGQG